MSEHGTRTRYSKGCRCGYCQQANARYLREWRQRQNPAWQAEVNVRSLNTLLEAVVGYDRSWMTKAACSGVDVRQFFPSPRAETWEPAQRVCETCPVTEQCLQYALDTDQDGVWGGTTKVQRQQLRVRQESA